MYERGAIVLVRFPFSDLTNARQRPAAVLSSADYQRSGEDVLVAAISGQRVQRPGPFDYRIEDWSAAGLLMPSVVRAGKLVTLHKGVIRRELGRLEARDLAAVDLRVRKALAL